MQADATQQKNASGLNREIQAKIGQQLRAVYDDIVQEGVPPRFVDLLQQLDRPLDDRPMNDDKPLNKETFE